jgi:dolichol kinase
VTSVALAPTRAWLIGIPGAFMFYAWTMEIARKRIPALNDRLMRFYGPIAHPQEWHRVNSATWYATALVLLALFATKPAMFSALVVLGFADPIAAMVGRAWGKRMLRTGRSLEGTLAFFVVGTIASSIALVIAHAGTPLGILLVATASGIAGAIAELYAATLDDNFTIPLAVGAIATVATPLLG